MAGETDLERLLATMDPHLFPTEYVFLTLSGGSYGDHRDLEPVVAVAETEGLTLVVPRQAADRAGFSYDAVFRMITLQVHSSLEAVGLTAHVGRRLAAAGISANVVAGFYHDHLFVPTQRAVDAVAALRG